MGVADLNLLSGAVKDAAIILDNGEVMWPLAYAPAAIDALIDAGLRVLGLDVRNPTEDGATEVALSSSDKTNLEDARMQAHVALTRVEEVTGWVKPFILITWRSRS